MNQNVNINVNISGGNERIENLIYISNLILS